MRTTEQMHKEVMDGWMGGLEGSWVAQDERGTTLVKGREGGACSSADCTRRLSLRRK